jgi:hypothetical protein
VYRGISPIQAEQLAAAGPRSVRGYFPTVSTIFLICEPSDTCRRVGRESVESLGQLVRHRQLGRVICVKLNDGGARVLGYHPPLQWRRDGPIPRTQHVIPVDAVEGSGRDGYFDRQRRDWLRALPCDFRRQPGEPFARSGWPGELLAGTRFAHVGLRVLDRWARWSDLDHSRCKFDGAVGDILPR